MTTGRRILITVLAIGAASAAQAACETATAAGDLTPEQAQALYDCIAADLHAGYMNGPKGWIPPETVSGYRTWTPASSHPARPGFHDNRFLTTWVNATGAAEYLRFDEDAAKMPAGSLIAKESFGVDAAGKVVPGPLFFMEKVAEGVSPETGDWYYYMVAANGAPQAVNVVTACADCHMGNFGYRDSLGYPVEEARITQ